MPEFFLELFSEEIPAGMQHEAATELAQLCGAIFAELSASQGKVFSGPRRIAISATINAEKPGGTTEARGPRQGAATAAVNGFLQKWNAHHDNLVIEDGYHVLRRELAPETASSIIQRLLPEQLRKMRWPKSMRWISGDDLSWVRPLRRIICLFDGAILPIQVGPLTADRLTEGHRILSDGTISISSANYWVDTLRDNYVIVDRSERRQRIIDGLNQKAESLGLFIVKDEKLVDEVTGLVEWPVPLIGSIDLQFLGLPAEVRELSMRSNQKYFALRDADKRPAPFFAFVANLDAHDGGAAIIAGNERVLRARLSDARYFWDIDLKTPLTELLPKLEEITFHAKLGTQLERANRIALLARDIADQLGADGYESMQAEWAGKLCKTDLVTNIVGEFPELQGIMGGYYAERMVRGWDGAFVGPAIKTHYQPKGPLDAVPTGIVAVSVALADKLHTLTQFFAIDEKPTGSGDPYALRRAALGVIRIILENNLRLSMKSLLNDDAALFTFIIDRLRVKLRGEGKRFDILDAVLAAGADDDLLRLMKRVDALGAMLGTDDGRNLLAAYKRAANILKIEEAKNEWLGRGLDTQMLVEAAESVLWHELGFVQAALFHPVEGTGDGLLADERYEDAMLQLASLRQAIDSFLENVTVNVENAELRRNRLRLLAIFRDAVNQIADFSKLEG